MKLLQRINNLSILFKTGLIVFFPLASLSVMLIENLQRDSLVVEDVVRVTEMVTWLGVLDDLTHLLALERGLTVGMSSGKEKEWKKHLVTHRKLVDRQIQHFLIVLKEADLSSMAPALQQLMSELKKGFQQLEELRLAADQRQPGAGSVENVFDYFSRLNKAALYLIQGMTLSVQDMEISRQLQMMTALLWLKERAGQERAVLRQLLLGVVVAPKISGAVGYLSQVQEDHLRDFQQYATPHQRNTYQQLMAGSALEEVVQMRDQFLMRMDKVSVLGRLRGQIGYGGMIYLFKNLVLRKDEGLFPQIHALHQQAQKSIIEFRSLKGVTTVELEALSQIEQALAQYHQKVEQLGELIGRGVTIDKMDQALRVNDSLALQALATLDQQVVKPSGDAHTWFESATSRIEQVSGVIDVLKNQLQDQVQIKAREARWVFLYHQLFQFSMILLSALVAIYLARVLLRSVQRSVDSIRKIDESGDFSIRIAVECQDEVGQMGEALNRLFRHQQQAIGDAIRVSAEVAAGRFGQKIEAPYHGDLAQLKQGINGSVERVEQNTQTLMNQNSEMEQILSSMDQGLIVSDLEGVVQRVNPKVEQLTGLFSEELLGQEWKGMVLEEDLSLDGMDGVLSAVDQVSNLIQSFESLKMLCEETLTAALVINPQGEIMVANSQMAWISGWPTDELTKRHFEVLIPPQLRQSHTEIYKTFIREPQLRKMNGDRVLPLYTQAGETKSVEIGIVPVKLEEAHWFLLLFNEFTDIRKRLLFETSPLGRLIEGQIFTRQCSLLHKSGKAVPVQVSSALLQSEDRDSDESVGVVMVINDLRERIHTEQQEQYAAFQAGVADMGATVIHNIGNAVTGMNGYISQIDKKGKVLVQLKEVLQRFSGELSLLKTEGAEAAVVESKWVDTQQLLIETAKVLERVAWETERRGDGALGHLASVTGHIREIIAIQKKSSSAIVHASRFNLQLMVNDTLHLLGDRLEGIELKAEVRLTYSQEDVFLPRNRLMQLLLNLLKNSVEAISEERHADHEKEGLIELLIEEDKEEAGFVMSITDNGCGHDAGTINSLFNARYTTKEQGSGYGLHSAANFVHSIGGMIRGESEGPHSGMKIIITLPFMLEES